MGRTYSLHWEAEKSKIIVDKPKMIYTTLET
jgi:hypothetical protein